MKHCFGAILECSEGESHFSKNTRIFRIFLRSHWSKAREASWNFQLGRLLNHFMKLIHSAPMNKMPQKQSILLSFEAMIFFIQQNEEIRDLEMRIISFLEILFTLYKSILCSRAFENSFPINFSPLFARWMVNGEWWIVDSERCLKIWIFYEKKIGLKNFAEFVLQGSWRPESGGGEE
jgi:hypothetical protein